MTATLCGADRSALLCLIVGHEAPYATDPPGRCRRPGCRAAYTPPDLPHVATLPLDDSARWTG